MENLVVSAQGSTENSSRVNPQNEQFPKDISKVINAMEIMMEKYIPSEFQKPTIEEAITSKRRTKEEILTSMISKISLKKTYNQKASQLYVFLEGLIKEGEQVFNSAKDESTEKVHGKDWGFEIKKDSNQLITIEIRNSTQERLIFSVDSSGKIKINKTFPNDEEKEFLKAFFRRLNYNNSNTRIEEFFRKFPREYPDQNQRDITKGVFQDFTEHYNYYLDCIFKEKEPDQNYKIGKNLEEKLDELHKKLEGLAGEYSPPIAKTCSAVREIGEMLERAIFYELRYLIPGLINERDYEVIESRSIMQDFCLKLVYKPLLPLSFDICEKLIRYYTGKISEKLPDIKPWTPSDHLRKQREYSCRILQDALTSDADIKIITAGTFFVEDQIVSPAVLEFAKKGEKIELYCFDPGFNLKCFVEIIRPSWENPFPEEKWRIVQEDTNSHKVMTQPFSLRSTDPQLQITIYFIPELFPSFNPTKNYKDNTERNLEIIGKLISQNKPLVIMEGRSGMAFEYYMKAFISKFALFKKFVIVRQEYLDSEHKIHEYQDCLNMKMVDMVSFLEESLKDVEKSKKSQ